MPDFYYIDLMYEPGRENFRKVVGGCVAGLLDAGCRFKKMVMSGDPANRGHASVTEHVGLKTGDVQDMAVAYLADSIDKTNRILSFPPWGRVVFEYDFRFDEVLLDDLHEEEEDTRMSATDMGLTFLYSENDSYGRRLKATISLWEEFVLTHGEPDTNRLNMVSVMRMVEHVARASNPLFGAMNNEIRLDMDGSHDALMKGRLPEGNEYALVGPELMDRLDRAALEASGLNWRDLPGGGVIIQFVNRWEGHGVGA